MEDGIVIIGAGQAGLSLAEALRAQGYDGRLSLIGEEPVPPYQRPPLSKKYLLGEIGVERLYLRPEGFYADHDITLITGAGVAALDRQTRRVALSDGRTLGWDRLALTTGAAPRRPGPEIGGDLAGAHVMRDLGDADVLGADMRGAASALVVGGGYVGLEAAAVLRARGLKVTVVEAAPRILGRVAPAQTADALRALHLARGVEIIEGAGLARLIGRAGRVAGAELADGRRIGADLAVFGIGVVPRLSLAEAAGLKIDNGIAVDEHGATSDPAIFAAGDVASFPWRGARIRLESVQNAVDQAKAAACAMLGRPVAYDPTPWFWSDQFDAKLQIAGLSQGAERVVSRPGARAGAESFWSFRGGRLIAVDALNDPRAYMTGKRWLEAGVSPEPEALADPAVELKGLA